jgi:hypothetical protein
MLTVRARRCVFTGIIKWVELTQNDGKSFLQSEEIGCKEGYLQIGVAILPHAFSLDLLGGTPDRVIV